MKKSGTILSWFFFGTGAGLALILFTGTIFNFVSAIQSVFAGLLFIVYRVLMDWKYFDNPIENKMRELAISEKISHNFLFTSITAGLVLFAFSFRFENLLMAFLLSLAAVSLMQIVIETIRLLINKAKQKQLPLKTKSFLKFEQKSKRGCTT